MSWCNVCGKNLSDSSNPGEIVVTMTDINCDTDTILMVCSAGCFLEWIKRVILKEEELKKR